MISRGQGERLDLAFRLGWLVGKSYAMALYQPACTRSKPRCPYWCPVLAAAWKIGWGLGCYDVLHELDDMA